MSCPTRRFSTAVDRSRLTPGERRYCRALEDSRRSWACGTARRHLPTRTDPLRECRSLPTSAASARHDFGSRADIHFHKLPSKFDGSFHKISTFGCKFQKIQAVFWHFPKFRQDYVKFAAKNHRFGENSAKSWQILQKKRKRKI